MGLVKNPLHRVIDYDYVKATQKLAGHFFVLTNGEHIGTFGVNGIIDKSVSKASIEQPTYLPGLAAGGVQWQDSNGNVNYPGVSDAELDFLKQIPDFFQQKLTEFCEQETPFLSSETIADTLAGVILNNAVSPTVNINSFYDLLRSSPEVYIKLQTRVKELMDGLLQKADSQGLSDSFFVHYAPNLGRDEQGLEVMRPATVNDSGTTDFQFMLTGALKEAGVVYLLNHYYHSQTGEYPLGKDFNPRQISFQHNDLLDLISNNFDRSQMPLMMGVGDTVNSQVTYENGQKIVKRGGSDRNFLQLIQDIGGKFDRDNVITYVDSSQGEVKNRKSVQVEETNGQIKVTEGPEHPEDNDEPLKINLVFPDGHQQYSQFFQALAQQKNKQS